MGPTLLEANPHLRDPEARRRALLRSVASSCAIEGIRAPFREALVSQREASANGGGEMGPRQGRKSRASHSRG